ncbi:MAG: dual specificity protein phosphatase family protein [bacterium]|nr:dual specificity protein phosphatase family protein [bacterium]
MDLNTTGSGDRPLANTYWVVPGRFLAGEYPGAADRDEASRKLRTLLGSGIDHFINLTQRYEPLERYAALAAEEADRLGMTVVCERHPITDMNVPRRPRDMTDILDALDQALEEGRNVYVHCWGGVGRTGTVVGCWLIRHGMTGGQALEQIAEWWSGIEKRYIHPRSPQTHTQRAYVRHWAEA